MAFKLAGLRITSTLDLNYKIIAIFKVRFGILLCVGKEDTAEAIKYFINWKFEILKSSFDCLGERERSRFVEVIEQLMYISDLNLHGSNVTSSHVSNHFHCSWAINDPF